MELTKQHFFKIYSSYLEPNTNTDDENVLIKCPFHNDKNPSYAVSTNPNNPVGHCFSCGVKHSWVGFYMQTRNVDYKTALKELEMFDNNYQKPTYVTPIETKKQEKKEIDYSEYCINVWNNTIMNEKYFTFYGKKLYELRGITYDTAVACMVGYDKEKGWIFPFCRYPDEKCTGYEIRHKEFKKFDFNKSKCYKAKDSVSCLSIIYKGLNNKKAIVCEGFIDGMKMYQYLHEKNQRNKHNSVAIVEETILTPTNGVKTIPNLIVENELWNKYNEVLFVLDNDEASNPITEELKQMTNKKGYNFKFFTGLKQNEDFENWYDERIESGKSGSN